METIVRALIGQLCDASSPAKQLVAVAGIEAEIERLAPVLWRPHLQRRRFGALHGGRRRVAPSCCYRPGRHGAGLFVASGLLRGALERSRRPRDLWRLLLCTLGSCAAAAADESTPSCRLAPTSAHACAWWRLSDSKGRRCILFVARVTCPRARPWSELWGAGRNARSEISSSCLVGDRLWSVIHGIVRASWRGWDACATAALCGAAAVSSAASACEAAAAACR